MAAAAPAKRRRKADKSAKAPPFTRSQAAKRYTTLQTVCFDDTVPAFGQKKGRGGHPDLEHAICEGVRFCLLQCARGGGSFKLAAFHKAVLPKSLTGGWKLNVLALTAAKLRDSFGLIVAPVMKTNFTTSDLEKAGKVAAQQDMTEFAIATTAAVGLTSTLSTVVQKSLPASDLARRGLLVGILSLIAQSPTQSLFEHELKEKLTDLDVGFSTDVHPTLGSLKDALSAFVAGGYLSRRSEVTDSGVSEQKRVAAYRFGGTARLHLGIGAVGSALKELEGGLKGDADSLMKAAGNNVLRSWYGLEAVAGKLPLLGKGGKKRERDGDA